MSLKRRLRRAAKQFRATGRGGPNVFLRVVHGRERDAEIVRATCKGRHYTRNTAETLNAFKHRVLADQPILPVIAVLYPSRRLAIAPRAALTCAQAIPQGIAAE